MISEPKIAKETKKKGPAAPRYSWAASNRPRHKTPAFPRYTTSSLLPLFTPVTDFLCLPLVFAALVLLAGCTVGPNYHRPDVGVPSSYSKPLAVPTNSPSATLEEWWRLFHDPQLDRLIEQATVANKDVCLAQARVREARA